MSNSNCYVMETSSFEKKRISVKQYVTNTIFAHIQILRKSTPLNLSNYDLEVIYKTIDNGVISHNVEKINSQKGIIGLIASYDLTNKHGEAYGEIHIKRAGAAMYTLQFFVDVKKSNLPEGSKPETDILKLEQKLEKTNKDLGSVETLTMKNVENVVSAINKLDSRTENVLKSNKQLDKKEIDNILSIFNI